MLRATLRGFLAHKGRLALSALAVVLSVAFVAGSLIFSDTVGRTFDRLFASTAADVTVQPKEDLTRPRATGAVRTLPATLARRLARVQGVRAAAAVVDVEYATVVDASNHLVGSTTGAPTIVSDWRPGPRSPVELTSGHAPRGPGEAVLDADTADRRRLGTGDTLTVQAPPGSFRVRVTGIATFTTTNPGATRVFLDTRTARTGLLGSPDRATAVAVTAAPGVSHQVLERRVAAVTGTTAYDVRTAQEQARSAVESLGDFLKVLKYVMVGFAAIAALVGIFLIINTFAILIAQRTREIGLLRALGADRRQVRRSVLTEALLLGLAGSTAGLGGGVALAYGLLGLMNAFGMNVRSAETTVGPLVPVAAYAVGLGVTFLAAYLPARRAGGISPMAALADIDVAGAGRPLRKRAVAGGVLGAPGAAALGGCAAARDTARATTALGAGIVLTLAAAVVAGPLLVRPVIRVLGAAFPTLFGAVGRMSRRNALRSPRRTGATASALMVGIALAGALSVAGASVTASLDRQIDRTLGADFGVQNASYLTFPQEVTDTVRRTDGVGLVVRQRLLPLALRLPDGARVETGATGYDPQLDQVAHVTYRAGDTRAALAAGSMAMDADFARDHRVRLGDAVPAELPGHRTARLRVAALTVRQDGGLGPQAGLVVGMSTVEKYLPRGQDSALYVNAAPGTDTGTLRVRLERALRPYPQVQVRNRADYKNLVHDQVSVLLYLVYALLGLAIVIAVLGVVNTLALSVVERTREIGLLRAVGLTRRQLRRMIRLESVMITVFGAVLGLVLGLVWGVCVQQVLALKGMTALAVPWTTIVAIAAGSVVVGVVAALLPALRASRMNVLAAVAYE